MARDQNTYAKQARATAKKRKAEDKRERRRKRKEQADPVNPAIDADAADTDRQAPGDQPQGVSEPKD
jgi:hypothetical protein